MQYIHLDNVVFYPEYQEGLIECLFKLTDTFYNGDQCGVSLYHAYDGIMNISFGLCPKEKKFFVRDEDTGIILYDASETDTMLERAYMFLRLEHEKGNIPHIGLHYGKIMYEGDMLQDEGEGIGFSTRNSKYIVDSENESFKRLATSAMGIVVTDSYPAATVKDFKSESVFFIDPTVTPNKDNAINTLEYLASRAIIAEMKKFIETTDKNVIHQHRHNLTNFNVLRHKMGESQPSVDMYSAYLKNRNLGKLTPDEEKHIKSIFSANYKLNTIIILFGGILDSAGIFSYSVCDHPRSGIYHIVYDDLPMVMCNRSEFGMNVQQPVEVKKLQ